MLTSSSEANHEIAVAIFDSFSKKVMRNLKIQEDNKTRKRDKKEIMGAGTMQYVTETYGREDIYPLESVITAGHKYSCMVTVDWLYQAMVLLPEKQKEVLILEFWEGLPIKEIAKTLHVIEKTVYNRKQRAFQFIRSYYERMRRDEI